jgi:hypothetical protein
MITDNTHCQVGIDWFEYTTTEALFPAQFEENGVEKKRGMFGYKRAMKFPDGRWILREGQTPGMGTHVIMSSGCLSEMDRRYGLSPFEIVYKLSQDSRCTRIDVALDILDGCLDFDQLALELKHGYANTRAVEMQRFRDLAGSGDTIYVGSAASKKRLRIYDKAAETRHEGVLWTRVELQSRHKYAQATVKKITADGFSAAVIPALISGFCDFPSNEEWKQVFYALPVKVTVPRQQSDNVLDWLIRQAAPALARLQHDKPHLKAYAVFNRAYNENFNALE